MHALDAIDRKILSLLQTDSRMTWALAGSNCLKFATLAAKISRDTIAPHENPN